MTDGEHATEQYSEGPYGWVWNGDGEPNCGSTEVAIRDDLRFSAFNSRPAPNAKYPDGHYMKRNALDKQIPGAHGLFVFF